MDPGSAALLRTEQAAEAARGPSPSSPRARQLQQQPTRAGDAATAAGRRLGWWLRPGNSPTVSMDIVSTVEWKDRIGMYCEIVNCFSRRQGSDDANVWWAKVACFSFACKGATDASYYLVL